MITNTWVGCNTVSIVYSHVGVEMGPGIGCDNSLCSLCYVIYLILIA